MTSPLTWKEEQMLLTILLMALVLVCTTSGTRTDTDKWKAAAMLLFTPVLENNNCLFWQWLFWGTALICVFIKMCAPQDLNRHRFHLAEHMSDKELFQDTVQNISAPLFHRLTGPVFCNRSVSQDCTLQSNWQAPTWKLWWHPGLLQ